MGEVCYCMLPQNHSQKMENSFFSSLLKRLVSAIASNDRSIMTALCSVGSQDKSSQLY